MMPSDKTKSKKKFLNSDVCTFLEYYGPTRFGLTVFMANDVRPHIRERFQGMTVREFLDTPDKKLCEGVKNLGLTSVKKARKRIQQEIADIKVGRGGEATDYYYFQTGQNDLISDDFWDEPE